MRFHPLYSIDVRDAGLTVLLWARSACASELPPVYSCIGNLYSSCPSSVLAGPGHLKGVSPESPCSRLLNQEPARGGSRLLPLLVFSDRARSSTASACHPYSIINLLPSCKRGKLRMLQTLELVAAVLAPPRDGSTLVCAGRCWTRLSSLSAQVWCLLIDCTRLV